MKKVFLFITMYLICTFAVAFPNLQLPFAFGEKWSVSRGYGVDTHINYGGVTSDDRYALDFTFAACGKSWGKRIVAAATGIVTFSGDGGNYGSTILIDHGDGYVTRYAHFLSLQVSVGESVLRGQEIGRVGNSGNVKGSCGAHVGSHLHFVLYRNGVGIKPEPMNGFNNFQKGVSYTSSNEDPFNHLADMCGYLSEEELVCWRGDGHHFAFCEDVNNHKRYFKVAHRLYDAAPYPNMLINNRCQLLREGINGPFIGSDDAGGLPPVSGSRTDLTPDFDIYDATGKEISSSNSTPTYTPVAVGQKIRLNLETEVSNDDTSNHLRDEDSDTIDGHIYYKVEGVHSEWQFLVREKYDIDELEKGESPDEEEWFTIPNYPDKIISLRAIVDASDEVREQSEGNNVSRTEKLKILEESRIDSVRPTCPQMGHSYTWCVRALQVLDIL